MKRLMIIPVLAGWVLTGLLYAAEPASVSLNTSNSVSQDSISSQLDTAEKTLKDKNYEQAIGELIKVIKQQQETINQLNKNQITIPPAPGPDATQEEKESFLKQMTKSLPFIGGSLGDAEEQWLKAYQLQHKAIFDMSYKEAMPVFEQAIVEYRKVVDIYSHSKRAPQAQRQIAWIYQTQLRKPGLARLEWQKLIQIYPSSQYAAEARTYYNEAASR
jgi:tetratricopeptide (TPR) repeat protein